MPLDSGEIRIYGQGVGGWIQKFRANLVVDFNFQQSDRGIVKRQVQGVLSVSLALSDQVKSLHGDLNCTFN